MKVLLRGFLLFNMLEKGINRGVFMVLSVNEQNFKEEVLDYAGTTLVDMYADWCVPCKRMSPVIEKLSEERLKNVKFCKLNIDEAPEIAGKYGIMSIPTFLIFRNGEIKSTFVGVTDEDILRKALSK